MEGHREAEGIQFGLEEDRVEGRGTALVDRVEKEAGGEEDGKSESFLRRLRLGGSL